MSQVSNKTLAAILVATMILSIGGTLASLNRLKSIDQAGITGMAATEYAGVNVTVTSTSSINFTVNNVNFGTGTVGSGCSFCILNTSGVTDGCCVSFTPPTPTGLVVQNIGNKNLTLNFSFDMTAATYIGGTGPLFQINVTENETNSCLNNSNIGPGTALNTTWNNTFGNVLAANMQICTNFRPEAANDELRVNVRLKIPDNSITGARNATLTATVAQAPDGPG